MQTVNSLSGGKTSSYLAYHYPADVELFALCCIDCHNAGGQIDKKMKQRVNDKLQKYCSHYPEFVATSEDPKVLKVMFDLEQMLGREIIWLRGLGWEEMIRKRKAMPNKGMRFCTSVMKMQPIFEHLLTRHEFPVKMRVGFRYDEQERKNHFTTDYKYPYKSEFRPKSATWIQRWKEIAWRVGEFPLIEDKILHHHVQQFWKDKGIDFPLDSNCQNCFWKPFQQLRKNFDSNPGIMQWTKVWEDLMERQVKKEYSFAEIERMALQLDFNFGTGAGCQAGFCTS